MDDSSEESKGLFLRWRSNFSSSATGITPAGQSLDISFRETINGKRHFLKIPGVSHHKFSSELGGGTKKGHHISGLINEALYPYTVWCPLVKQGWRVSCPTFYQAPWK